MASLREGVEDFTQRHEGTKRRVGKPTPKAEGISNGTVGPLVDLVFMARLGLGLKEVKRAIAMGCVGKIDRTAGECAGERLTTEAQRHRACAGVTKRTVGVRTATPFTQNRIESALMKPPKIVFVCQECGSQSPKWVGRCPECGAWNSMSEERAAEAPSAATGHRYSQRATSQATLYAEVETAHAVRLSTGIGEFDRVLGGGVVPGSLVLLGGEPGTTTADPTGEDPTGDESTGDGSTGGSGTTAGGDTTG